MWDGHPTTIAIAATNVTVKLPMLVLWSCTFIKISKEFHLHSLSPSFVIY